MAQAHGHGRPVSSVAGRADVAAAAGLTLCPGVSLPPASPPAVSVGAVSARGRPPKGLLPAHSPSVRGAPRHTEDGPRRGHGGSDPSPAPGGLSSIQSLWAEGAGRAAVHCSVCTTSACPHSPAKPDALACSPACPPASRGATPAFACCARSHLRIVGEASGTLLPFGTPSAMLHPETGSKGRLTPSTLWGPQWPLPVRLSGEVSQPH